MRDPADILRWRANLQTGKILMEQGEPSNSIDQIGRCSLIESRHAHLVRAELLSRACPGVRSGLPM